MHVRVSAVRASMESRDGEKHDDEDDDDDDDDDDGVDVHICADDGGDGMCVWEKSNTDVGDDNDSSCNDSSAPLPRLPQSCTPFQLL
jgi:hypothetical protein